MLGYLPLNTRAEESDTAADAALLDTEPATEPVTEPATEPVTEPATETESEEALLPETSAMAAAVQYPISGSWGALTWELTKDGLMTISGAGEMPYGDIPWADYKDKMKTLVVEEGVTTIGVGAFEDCTALSSVTLPQTLSRILYNAFSNCTSLKSIDLPTGITSIETAFSGSGLESITIPESVTSMGSSMFEGCTALKSVHLQGAVTQIGERAFQGCTALKSIDLPDAVNEIGVHAFYGCTALERIDLPAALTKIERFAFQNSGLKSIFIPKSVTTLESAFANAFNLTTVTIEDI